MLEEIHVTIYDDICWWFQDSPEVSRSADVSASVTLSDADKLKKKKNTHQAPENGISIFPFKLVAGIFNIN